MRVIARKILLGISFFSIISFMQIITSNASEQALIELVDDNQLESFQETVDITVHVRLKDIEINDAIYLSCHLLDPESKEDIQYENLRVPLYFNEEGEAITEYKIETGNLFNQYKRINAELDIVDEKNSYWFSRDPEIKMESVVVKFENNPSKKIIANIQMRKPIFTINLAVCIIWIIVWRMVKHKFW